MKNTKPVAIITGASKGMGAATARELKQRGYELALFSTTGAKELATELSALSVSGSVAVAADLEKLVTATIEKYGRIDAVVNSTGHPPKGKLLELTDANWHDGMDLIFLNAVRMAKLVTPYFLKQGQGAIVNISTFAAFEPTASFPISSPLRAALAAYAKIYSDEYANKKIRMNNVLPGFIESYEIDDKIRASIPMHRSGKLTEIAKTIAFLLSDDAGYITGQNLRVDGGLTRHV